MFLGLELFIFWFNLFVRPPEEALPIVEPVLSEPLPVKSIEQPVSENSTSTSISSQPRKNCFKIVLEKSVNGFTSLPGEIQLIAFLFVCMVPQMIHHTLTK